MRLASPLALAVLAASCGDRPPATFVGESPHFRLYVDPALMPLPAAFAGENALAALETNWADFATMLKMPDGKISYYWYAQEHVSAACQDEQGGCTKEDEMEIDAAALPDAHELVHAYTYLRAARRPIPFLAEGFAEAIGCGYEKPYEAPFPAGDWRGAVAAIRSHDVYGLGGRFARQMIRRHGIDDFLRYYEQSPERRDPALFAANFESFWGESIDDVWREINTVELAVPFIDEKICPCSLPAIVASDSVVADPARIPYWTVPELGDDTLAVTAGRYQQVSVRSCAGNVDALLGKGVLARLGKGVLARLGKGVLARLGSRGAPQAGPPAGWYVVGPVVAAGIDRYVAESCAEAAHYTLSPDVLVGDPRLTIALPAPPSESTTYLAIDVPFPLDMRVAGLNVLCDSCAFDQGSCPPATAATPVPGDFFALLHTWATPASQRFGFALRQLSFSR